MQDENTPFEFDPTRFAAWSVILAVSVAILLVGKSFLIPLAIALLLWILLDAIRDTIIRLAPTSESMPGWIATTLAIAVIVAANYFVVSIITSQSDALTAAIPVYEANFQTLLADISARLGIEQLPTTAMLLQQVDLAVVLTSIGDSVTAVMSNIILIAIYVGFLLAEENVFPKKIRRLQREPENAARVQQLASNVSSSIQRYIGMKTVVSLITGLISYVVLRLVGVDFAAIWALLIFFLNFIPNIGSVLGVAFPALLTLVQFDTPTPFLLVTVGLGLTQFVIGNVIEPSYMGKSLNMSSFMIILSLSFWGAIWGLPGMFLAVPLMVVTGIVCAHFKGLRWVSVMLSADGRLIEAEKPS